MHQHLASFIRSGSASNKTPLNNIQELNSQDNDKQSSQHLKGVEILALDGPHQSDLQQQSNQDQNPGQSNEVVSHDKGAEDGDADSQKSKIEFMSPDAIDANEVDISLASGRSLLNDNKDKNLESTQPLDKKESKMIQDSKSDDLKKSEDRLTERMSKMSDNQ